MVTQWMETQDAFWIRQEHSIARFPIVNGEVQFNYGMAITADAFRQSLVDKYGPPSKEESEQKDKENGRDN